jgi:hypothetical protein
MNADEIEFLQLTQEMVVLLFLYLISFPRTSPIPTFIMPQTNHWKQYSDVTARYHVKETMPLPNFPGFFALS